jgi:hypothetical protein
MAALAIAGEGNWLVVRVRIVFLSLRSESFWPSFLPWLHGFSAVLDGCGEPCLRLIKTVCAAKMKVEHSLPPWL